MPSLTKNLANTAKIGVQGTSTILGIITNPFFIIFMVVLFFPADIINYFALYFINFFIVLANIAILIGNLLVQFLWGAIVALLNAFIDLLNGISFTIPLPDPLDDIDINPFNFSHIDPPGATTWGFIPYKTIEWASFLPDTFFLKWILEFIGII